MNKMEELIAASKIGELMQKQETENKQKNTIICIFAAVGVVLAVAGIAYIIYNMLQKKKYEDFEEDFEDDFEDDFFEDDDDTEF